MSDTTYWVCDSCDNKINTLEDGWVQWTYRGIERPVLMKFGIVHHRVAAERLGIMRGCYLDELSLPKGEYLQDGHLDWFVGPTGLDRLLRILERSEYVPVGWVEIVRRLHIPGYETERQELIE